MPSSSDNLTLWIQGLTSLKAACSQVNTSTLALTLNTFAKSKIASLLPGGGNLFTFINAANSQFKSTGPAGWTLSGPIDSSETFAGLINDTLFGELSYFVYDFIQPYCSPASTNPQGALLATTPLTVAFPAATSDPNWNQLIATVKALNLHQVIAPTALTTANQIVTPPTPSTLNDLIATLSTT
jgi:hypothetical protein